MRSYSGAGWIFKSRFDIRDSRHTTTVRAHTMTLEELRASLQACEEILARVEARHPSLPLVTREAIESVCREFRDELARRTA
jgi:hypothetical protein